MKPRSLVVVSAASAWLWCACVPVYPVWAQAHGIILDPGHSAQKFGARSCSGGKEYAFNNALTATVSAYLAERGFEIAVTRKEDEDLSLAQRAEKSQGKKLLLSIHHDSAQPKFITMRNGNPCSTKVKGYAIFVSEKNPYYEQSLAYARHLGQALRALGLRPSTHHGEPIQGENRPCLDARLGIYQYDDLVVLKKAHAPALLLEAAVIINPEDEARARSSAYQRQIAGAIETMLRRSGLAAGTAAPALAGPERPQ